MFKQKIVFLFAVYCILLVNCLSSQEVVSSVVAPVEIPLEVEGKINWSPVWDDNEGNNEFVSRTSPEDSKEEYLEKCKSPNGLGLEHLFREVDKILPKQQIKTIVKSYAEDPEIKALKAFMKNPQTKEKVKAIHSSQEYQILKDYVCHVLHIDLHKYGQLTRTLIQPLLTRTDTESRKGIRGLIDEINAILPRQALRDLYKNLLSSDDELAKAVDSLKSKEFRQLLLNVKNNVPEYQELRQQLIGLGVPMEEMKQLLDDALGWAAELDLVV